MPTPPILGRREEKPELYLVCSASSAPNRTQKEQVSGNGPLTDGF